MSPYPRPLALVPILVRAVAALRRPPPFTRMPSLLLAGLALAAPLLGGCAGSANARAAPGATTTSMSRELSAPMRMRQVALFSSGVGYFEQGGTVPEGGMGTLTFTTDQLDDALKSLVIEDSTGTVATLEYPSTLPLQRLLHDSTVDISGQPSLATVLDHLRGTALKLIWHGETLHGTILNVEIHTEVGIDGAATVSHEVLNLLQDGHARQVPLAEVEQMRFLDPQVHDLLLQALMAIRSARSDLRRTVGVHTRGAGAQQVRIGYVTAAPMWKSSYRLVLSSADPAQAHLQGWAIVENQSDDDWQHVALSLISGRPQSFIQRLSQPLLMQRPQIDPVVYASLRPQLHEAALRQRQMSAITAAGARVSGMFGTQQGGGDQHGAQARGQAKTLDAADQAPLDLTRSIAVALHSDDLADRTSFTLDDVSLPRDRSALLPLLNQPLRAENLSIYTVAAGLAHPLRGVMLTNTSALNLGQGPVGVFDATGWIGDALLPDLPAHDHRLLSYAVDLDIAVRVEPPGCMGTITGWRLSGGVMTLTEHLTMTTVYHIDDHSSGQRTLIIEVPRQPGCTFTHMPAPFEVTPEMARFRITLDGMGSTSFTVHASSTTEQSFQLDQIADVQSVAINGSERLPPVLAALIEQISQVRRAIAGRDQHQTTLEAGLASYSADQKRVRRIRHVLRPDHPLAQRLDTRLSSDETQVEIHQAAISALISEREVLKQRLDQLLQTVDASVQAQ